MKKYLPSKTFVGVATPLTIGFAVAGFVIYMNVNQISAQQQPALVALTDDTLNTIDQRTQQEQDYDGDQLKDWEEILWNTDPDNPDTDGDGELDGLEVSLGRNPVVPGPDDLLEHYETNKDTGKIDSKIKTRTENFTEDFLSSYLTLRVGGKQLPDTTVLGIAEDLADNAIAPLQPEPLDVSEITFYENVTEHQVRTYHRDLQGILHRFSFITEDSLRDIYKTTSQGYNFEVFADYPEFYTDARDDLLVMTIPAEVRDAHILLAESINDLRRLTEALMAINEDPVYTLNALATHEQIAQKKNFALQSLMAFFAGHNLTLTIEE